MADNDLRTFKSLVLGAALDERGGPKGDGVHSCLFCGDHPPQFYSAEGRAEFRISGLCEYCFDKTMTEDEDCCATCHKPWSWHEHDRAGACGDFAGKRDPYEDDDV